MTQTGPAHSVTPYQPLVEWPEDAELPAPRLLWECSARDDDGWEKGWRIVETWEFAPSADTDIQFFIQREIFVEVSRTNDMLGQPAWVQADGLPPEALAILCWDAGVTPIPPTAPSGGRR